MKKTGLSELIKIMKKLRSPGGCPWDREQTAASLAPYIIEEAYEVVGAIDSGNWDHIKEELGDLLFQVVFVSQLAAERSEFDISDVIKGSSEKMIRRHPHVFAGETADTSGEVLSRWAQIKKMEKDEEKGATKESALSGVPEHFPALLRAHKLTEKAAKVGFDWENLGQVMAKVSEELGEFKEALEKKDVRAMEDELGDLIFALVNVGRFIEVNPEEALRKTIGRFVSRFHHIESKLEEEGKQLAEAPLEEMERLWEEAKGEEAKGEEANRTSKS